MKKNYKTFPFAILIAILFISCKKEEVTKLDIQSILTVDVEGVWRATDVKSYIAAYTSEGRLLGFGSLSDSSKWELKSDYKEKTVDILYYDVYTNNGTLNIHHFRNFHTGQQYSGNLESKPSFSSPKVIPIVLKVEDFGNRLGSNTGTFAYEQWPHKHVRGFSYPFGEFLWDQVTDGYTFVRTNIDLGSDSQNLELILFERGTNIPHVCYLDFNTASINIGDTVLLKKSDFTTAELKTVQIKLSSNLEIGQKLLYTYNSLENRRDLITSFEFIPETDKSLEVRYVKSSLPLISSWNFRCTYTSAYGARKMSYSINTNKEIPESIFIDEINKVKIYKSETHFDFTHGNVFPDKKLSNSQLCFYKQSESTSFNYNYYFNENESIGSVSIIPFVIPRAILNLNDDYSVLNTKEWLIGNYSQTYSDISNFSPSELLHKFIINGIDSPLISNKFYEKYTTSLQ